MASVAWASESVLALDRQTARQLVDPVKHTKPTIVALWSTDCPHCKKNLELYARMVQQDARVQLLTVAAEPPWDGIAKPLDKLSVPGKRYAYGDDAPEALMHALDPAWRGELPRTLFFDGHGGRQAVSGLVDEAKSRKLLGLSSSH